MLPMICPYCGGRMELEERTLCAFSCPYCGGGLIPCKNGKAWILNPGEKTEQDDGQAQAEKLVKQATAERDPVKAYGLLTKADALYPDSLAVQRALLYQGRLHERSPKKMDLSVIKCYILHVFDQPENLSADKRQSMLEELFQHPQLIKCLSLAEDQDQFMQDYLLHISRSYVSLFLKGNSQYTRSIFGFSTGKAEKVLAVPAARMIRTIRAAEELELSQRVMLEKAFYQGFVLEMDGVSDYLDDQLAAE